jgi:putative flippase GtrA
MTRHALGYAGVSGLYRMLRFGMVCVLTTIVAYIVFIPLLNIMTYPPAMVIAWTASMVTGFTLNRRFTFRVAGAGQGRQFVLYAIGALLQLGVAIAGYGFFAEWVGLHPTPAFLCNIVLTTGFSFAFMNLVAFRRG